MHRPWTRIAVALWMIALWMCAPAFLRADESPDPPGAVRMVQQLDDEDWILRSQALHYVGQQRVSAAGVPVLAILRDESNTPWIRGRALVALARIEPKIAGEELNKFAGAGEPVLRFAAAETMETLPDDAALATLLGDDVPRVRYRALAAYARHNGADAWERVAPLTESLDEMTLEWGARALAFVATDEALSRLQRLTADAQRADLIIRGIVAAPNPKVLPLQLELLARVDRDSHEFAALLTSLSRHERGALIAAMQVALKEGDAKVVRAMALVTTRLVVGPEIGDALRNALTDIDDAQTIQQTLAALGPTSMQPDRHQDLFTAHLDHKDVTIRALSIRCLAHCKDVNLYDVLRDRLRDPEPAVVHAALGALRRAPTDTVPSGQLVPYLRVAFENDNPITRDMAYELLGHAGGEEDFQPALAALGELLRGGDDERRAAAAEALGKIAPPTGIEQLVRKQGYVSSWRVLGTFLNDRENNGFHKTLPPDEKIDFAAKYKAKYVWDLAGEGGNKGEIEREIEWTEAAVDKTDGRLVVPPLVPPPASLSVAFAVADFRSRDEQDVFLHIDGDDAFRVWLNGKQVAEQVAEYRHRHACVAQQNSIQVKLQSGQNRLIVKTANIDFQWWVRLRFTDVAGYPVEVQTP